MKELQIKFSHEYPKIHGQKIAKLLSIEIVERINLTDKFIDYDTIFDGGFYSIPKGKYMILIFLGGEFIPFTTVRRWTPEKFRYYELNIGKIFNLSIEG